MFIAGLFVLAANELAAIEEHRGDPAEAGRLRAAAERMVAAVDAHGWDGEWFRRAYDFFGEPVGSAANDEGQIFIEPQGICIMAGIGLDDGRAVRALAVGPRAARDAARDRPPAAGVHELPAPARARSRRTRRATRRTPGSSATRTRG